MSDEGLREFCRVEYARLVGVLALQVVDRTVAEELAQDAIVQLAKQWPKVRDMQRQRAWLHAVASNLANSWWRRRYAERRAMRRLEAFAVDATGPDPADAIAVRDAIAALPVRQRQALVLRYYSGMTSGEVADHMGCAPSTVRVLTHQAIGRLREVGQLHAGSAPAQLEGEAEAEHAN